MAMRYHDSWGWGWGWMMVVMPLLWIALTAVVVWAVLRLAERPAGPVAGPPRPEPPRETPRETLRETPREILDRRFAAGEIDADTYTQAKAHLADQPR